MNEHEYFLNTNCRKLLMNFSKIICDNSCIIHDNSFSRYAL